MILNKQLDSTQPESWCAMPTIETCMLRENVATMFFEETASLYRILTMNGTFYDVYFEATPCTADTNSNLVRQALQVRKGILSLSDSPVTLTYDASNVAVKFSWNDQLPSVIDFQPIMEIQELRAR